MYFCPFSVLFCPFRLCNIRCAIARARRDTHRKYFRHAKRLMSNVVYKLCDILQAAIVYYKKPKEITVKQIQLRFMIFFQVERNRF